MEIKVVVPDPLAASDLTWFLDASARVTKNVDGGCVVYIQAGENMRHILAEIRKWLALNNVGAVVVHVGDDAQTLTSDA
jgi:hypothetical protein